MRIQFIIITDDKGITKMGTYNATLNSFEFEIDTVYESSFVDDMLAGKLGKNIELLTYEDMMNRIGKKANKPVFRESVVKGSGNDKKTN